MTTTITIIVLLIAGGGTSLLMYFESEDHRANSEKARTTADNQRTIAVRQRKIADELAPQIENVHFEDHIEDGEIHFDYRLRQGVVTKSNALALMRAVGLDV